MDLYLYYFVSNLRSVGMKVCVWCARKNRIRSERRWMQLTSFSIRYGLVLSNVHPTCQVTGDNVTNTSFYQ